jgi:hypothetical protein
MIHLSYSGMGKQKKGPAVPVDDKMALKEIKNDNKKYYFNPVKIHIST